MQSRILLTCIFCLTASFAQAKTYLTFYLGGQSNMDGYGYVNELSVPLTKEQDVMIFHGNGVLDNQPNGGIGLWEKLKPGHGVGFKSDGKTNRLSDRFGPEITFAKTLSEALPGENIALIKYAVGGTGLALNTGFSNWSPDYSSGKGINQYDNALTTIRNALQISDIDGDGEADKLIPAGIIWMQGEADALSSKSSAESYLFNIKRLMGLLRGALNNPELPVVIGKITDSGLGGKKPLMPYIETVQNAQLAFVKADSCAAYMTNTEEFEYSEKDPWHYLSQGFLKMGEGFANDYLSLRNSCSGRQ